MTSIEEVLAMMKAALKAAGQKETPKIRRDYPEIGESAVSLYDGDLNIYPTMMTAQSLGYKREVPGWAVDTVVHIPGTYWEPSDTDVVEVGTWQSAATAVTKAVLYLVERDVDDAIRGVIDPSGEYH